MTGSDERDVSRAIALLRDLGASKRDLHAYLADHPEAATAKVADELHKFSSEALLAGQLDTASIAASVGGVVNIRLGRMREAVGNREVQLQVEYQRATSTAEYETVRQNFVELAERARGYGEGKRELTAYAFMIQAGYFGAQAAETPEDRERWIRRALGDIITTLRSQPAPMEAEDATRLMESMFAPLDMATGELWLEQTTIEAVLRDLSREIDRHIAADAPLSADPARDAAIAVVLARLPAA
jgi:hypothetical protein